MALPDGNYLIENVIFSFPHIAELDQYGEGKPRYTLTLLTPQGSEQQKQIETLLWETAKAKWPNIKPAPGMPAGAGVKHSFVNGDTKPDVAGYEGRMALSTVLYPPSKPDVGVRNPDGTLSEMDPSLIQGGNMGDVVVRPFCTLYEGIKRVSFAFHVVVKTGEGEPFTAADKVGLADLGVVKGAQTASLSDVPTQKHEVDVNEALAALGVATS